MNNLAFIRIEHHARCTILALNIEALIQKQKYETGIGNEQFGQGLYCLI